MSDIRINPPLASTDVRRNIAAWFWFRP